MMKILAIESATEAASCALSENGKIVAEFTLQNKQTHSQTLLPMIDAMCRLTGTRPQDLDAIAVSRGPGSFTGLRIGAATGKGIALPYSTKVAAVPTLLGMAYRLGQATGRLLVPVIDARRSHVYTAGYSFEGQDWTKTETIKGADGNEAEGAMMPAEVFAECVLSAEDLAEKLKEIGRPVTLIGDGTRVVFDTLQKAGVDVRTCPLSCNFASAAGVALAGEALAHQGKLMGPDELTPEYLRLSQAERKRNEAAAQAKKK